MKFQELLILEAVNDLENELFEALRIVKKVDKRQSHIDTAHDDEIKTTKDSLADYTVGTVNGIVVKKTIHAREIRKEGTGAGKPRDYGIEDSDVLEVIRKLFLNPKFRPNIKTMVSYKNSKGKYDFMVIILSRKVLNIITFIQKSKRTPYEAFPKGRKEDSKVVVESFEGIDLSEIEGIENVIILD